MRGVKITDFTERSKKVHGDYYDYSRANYVNFKTKLEIVCPMHSSFWTTPLSHIYLKSGCPTCGLKKRKTKPKKTTEEFVKKSNVVHDSRYGYTKAIYTSSSEKLIITCHDHGDFEMAANNHLNGSGCPACNNSKGELKIASILTKFAIPFIPQYRIDETLYRYDFYLPMQNILIEFHGVQHYKPVEHWGGESGFINQRFRDSEKIKLAKTNNLPLIVLNYQQLNSGVLEQSLVRELNMIYKHWYVFENKLLVFKSTYDACVYFKLPKTPLVTYFNKLVMSKYKNLYLLFN